MPFSTDQWQKLLEQAHQKYPNPAIALSVFNAEDILFESAVGVRNIQTENIVKLDDYFHI